jgi:hypothetical protein
LQNILLLKPHLQLIFRSSYFEYRVSWTICPDWPQTLILQISASHVARITGMSHGTKLGLSFLTCKMKNWNGRSPRSHRL